MEGTKYLYAVRKKYPNSYIVRASLISWPG
jgi:hypothetical protein